jgi:hypothetical protein
MSGDGEYVDVLRLSRAEIGEIVAEIEASSHQPIGVERRRDPRMARSDFPAILVEMTYTPSHTGKYRAVSWNVSRKGLGFLHGKFVCPGTKCRVHLATADNDVLTVAGTITHCRLHRGRVHEVGMVFDEPLASIEPILVPHEVGSTEPAGGGTDIAPDAEPGIDRAVAPEADLATTSTEAPAPEEGRAAA